MIRYILIFWAAPVGVFWGWYYLSLNDINFGLLILSRRVHDFVFDFYGHFLGVDPASIPAFVGRSCLFDAGFLALFCAFRRRREIAAWWRRRKDAHLPVGRNATIPGE